MKPPVVWVVVLALVVIQVSLLWGCLLFYPEIICGIGIGTGIGIRIGIRIDIDVGGSDKNCTSWLGFSMVLLPCFGLAAS